MCVILLIYTQRCGDCLCLHAMNEMRGRSGKVKEAPSLSGSELSALVGHRSFSPQMPACSARVCVCVCVWLIPNSRAWVVDGNHFSDSRSPMAELC